MSGMEKLSVGATGALGRRLIDGRHSTECLNNAPVCSSEGEEWAVVGEREARWWILGGWVLASGVTDVPRRALTSLGVGRDWCQEEEKDSRVSRGATLIIVGRSLATPGRRT